ncbi:3-demethylubiquinone-9 3-methyltransferase [Listeria floridensis FSL S10-1187]|uniref:3-demethylubiquinone-9 3-methyltransferase n=1 Tax=Listeria floridensis FSL S10-1187 TaxID=1265817 RepID=A0ABP3B187_9LIST|nr:VOC family protein [Listeria floridensis]EUJ33680.1 3-demethylubiquinone-9 3-methyltransferase [Listeria floridensis FSL S10-1187]
MTDSKITPFLTFSGDAEEAVTFYVSLFANGKLLSLTRFSEGERGEPGKVLNAEFELSGEKFMAMDMEEKYAVPFSWATSFLFKLDAEAEFDRLFEALSEGGTVMMGPEAVGDFQKVAWITDRFGVTWQLVY